jgi:Tat protein translocase TatB subunit
MFGMGTQEILIVLVVALIFIGPKRLPEIAKALGKGFGELRRAANDLKGQIDLETMMEDREEETSAASSSRSNPEADHAEAPAETSAYSFIQPDVLSPAHEQEKKTDPEKTED